MEIEPKKHRFTKRRERAQKLTHGEGSNDELDSSPPRSSKDKCRSKPRRRRNSSNSIEEDIIDGYAIVSFKTLGDLENAVKNSMNLKATDNKDSKIHHPNKRKTKKKKVKKYCNPPSPHLPRLSDSSPVRSPSSDETEGLSDSQQRTVSQDDRLSDASSHSSSGRGYLCDSESGDDRASNASSDIFSTVNRNRECLVPSTTSCSSPCSTPVATTTTTSTNNSISANTVTITTIATTTSSYTTATATTPTSSTTTTTCVSASKTTASSVIINGPVATPSTKKPLTPPVTRSPQSTPGLPRSHTHSRPPSGTPLHREQRKITPPPPRTPRKEEYSREKDFPLPSNLPFSKPWVSGNNPNHLFNPISHSPGLPPFSLHSNPSNHTPPFPTLPPSAIHPHPPAPQTPGHPSMFAAPLPPGTPAGQLASNHNFGGGALSSHSPADSMSIASQEILREELNRRFLAQQERPAISAIGPTPYMRTDIHQHQHMHQHQHQHTHQHMYPIPPPFTGSLVPTPAPHLFEKIPKHFESPFYRTASSLSGYPGVSPLLPPSGQGPLNSGIPGAFQPKRVGASLHPSQMMLSSLRDKDKVSQGPVTSTTLPPHKKSGKWCAMHVKIAWEIHQQQQKAEANKGSEGKSLDPMQGPGHHLPGGSIHRPTDLSSASSMLGSHSRSMFENNSNNLPGASHLNNPSFSRPSPYPFAGLGGFGGLGGNPFSGAGREMPRVPGITSPHEWNRLHRTPPSFPSASTWAKPEDRDKEREKEIEWEREKEREREKEKEKESFLGLDRRREDERERYNSILEKRNSERERHNSINDRGRDREKPFPNSDQRHSSHSQSRSRSRSRSPLVNGRFSSAKTDPNFDRRFDDKSVFKIKEERRDDDVLSIEREREKQLRNEYLFGAMGSSNSVSASLLDRARFFTGPSPYSLSAAERMAQHPGFWNPMEKSAAVDFNPRIQYQQDMEQVRDRMYSRLHPSLHPFEHDRMRKEELLMQEERIRRDYLERLPLFERERLAFETSRLPPLRPSEHLGPSHFQRTISPMINHTGSKGGSPACLPGAPPPLIPSSTATSRSHSNSPAVGKPKLPNPVDLEKRDSYSNSTDLDNR